MVESAWEGVEDLLNDAIDRIAGCGATPEPAEVVASSLKRGDLRQAAIIHLSALLETEPSNVDGGEIVIGGLSIRLVPTDDPTAPIRYDNVGARFAVERASVVRRDGPTSLSALLYLYQYARDRSDILLYLPPAMRAERIARLAGETGASERFVRYVLARYPTLSARVAV